MNWQKTSYLNLATKKRDGSFVNTPVWFALEGDTFYVFSEKSAGKVKRIRNFSDVLISPCTVTGKITGLVHSAKAQVLHDANAEQRAYQALLKKYGWQLRLLNCGSFLAGKIKQRAFIAIQCVE